VNSDPSLWMRISRKLSLVLVVAAVSVAARGQTSEVAGWVEPDPKTQVVPAAAFRLDRAGKVMGYTEACWPAIN
jgi:hypothetical protein